MRTFIKRRDVRFSVVYGIIATAWIVISEALIGWLFAANRPLFMTISMLKGLGFVWITTLALFAIMSSERRKRFQAETALREERNLLRTLIDTIPDRIFVKDSQSRFLINNAAHLATLGVLTQGAAVGKTDFDFFPAQEGERFFADEQKVIQTGQPLIHREESATDHPTGRITWLDTIKTPLRDQSGQIIGLVGISRDITERQQAGAALRESNERFETLFRYSPDAIFLMDFATLAVVDCNEAACQMNGYAREELIGRSIDFLNVTPNTEDVSQQLKERLRREGVLHLQQEHWRKDGSRIMIDNSVCRLSIAGHELIVGIDRDVTEHKRAEDALAEERNLLRTLIDQLPDNVFIKDTTGRIITNNIAHQILLGVTTPEQAVGKTDFDFFSPDLAAAYFADDQSIIASGMPLINKEEPTVTREGSTRWLLTTKVPLRNSLGQVIGLVGINRDITERKQMETTLKQSEARFRLLIEESPLGIAVVRNGLLLYANQALLDLFDYQALPDLAQADLLEHVALPDRQRVQAVMQESQLTPPFTLELLSQRTDGTVFPALLRVGLIPLGDGPAYIAFVTDITERKRLEEERMVAERLQVELDKEKELSDLKDRFISMVSHEYRTPLAVILSSTDLLRSYADRLPPEKRQKLLDDIRVQVNYMDALLEDVLTISKARTGKLIPNPVRVDVETYCQRVFEAVQLADHGVHRFTLMKASEPVGCAEVDDHLLRQILTNLLSNAAKYSPQDTEIRLELGREAPHIIFRVSDQGIGIPATDQARLFEPFHRAQNVGTTQGTGLGLTVVKHNVEALGGTITFTSDLGIGTTFTVRLPVLADDVTPRFLSRED